MKAFIICAYALLAFTALPLQAHAQDGILTKANITAYLKQSNEILEGNAGKFSPAEVQSYLEKHLTGNFLYQDSVTTNLGPFGSGTEVLRYDRDQYINDILANIHSVEKVQSRIRVGEIQIGGNGQKARVTYSMEAQMQAQNDQLSALSSSGKNLSFSIDASSDCITILNWSQSQGAIQSEQLVCKSNATMNIPREFNPFQN